MSPHAPRTQVRVLILLAAVALVLTGVGALSAFTTLGRHFPSLVVDAYGFYSIVELPKWESPDRRPEDLLRLVSVDGKPLPDAPPHRLLRELYTTLQNIPVGQRITLVFQGPEGPYPVTAPVSRLGAEEFLFFFVTYALAAWLVLWASGLVFIAGGHAAAGRAYALWSVSSFLFLISFYDYHTNAWLAPLFSLSTVGILLGTLWLAYAFPKAPQSKAVGARWVLIVLTVLGAGAALVLVMAPLASWSSRPIRRAIDVLMGPGFAALALGVLIRLRRSTGLDRSDLITAAWGLAITPLMIGIVHMLRLATFRDAMHLVLPFIVLIFPLSIGYALIRNNILESRLVLTPSMVLIPFALGALLISVLGTYLIYLGISGDRGMLPLLILLGLLIFIIVMMLARRLQVRLFFPSVLAFRGTVGRLKDQLAALSDLFEIRRAVEKAVAQALPTRSAQVLEPQEIKELSGLTPDAREQLNRGENVWTDHRPRDQHLLVPMRSQGELCAILSVAPKHVAALYTREDLHLLETLASLGALALHNAAIVQEIEALRRLEVGAAREEKRLFLNALGAEISHEMVYPMNFLRDLLQRSSRGQPLDEEDLSFARRRGRPNGSDASIPPQT